MTTTPTVPQQEAEAREWLRREFGNRLGTFYRDEMECAYLAGKAAGLAQAKAMVDAAREGKLPC